jgi:hypothetical protein
VEQLSVIALRDVSRVVELGLLDRLLYSVASKEFEAVAVRVKSPFRAEAEHVSRLRSIRWTPIADRYRGEEDAIPISISSNE